MPQDPVSIRPMQADEPQRIRAIARRAFPWQMALFFSLSDHVFVAERDGRAMGSVVLETFALPGGRKAGLVSWILVDPDAQGQGMGQALADAALAFLEKEGCTEILACVEGHNTRSGRLWAHRGMGILSPGEQVRRYGLGIVPLWLRTMHFLDVGQFLWARPAPQRRDRPWLQWWGVCLVNALLVWLALWRQHGFHTLPASLLAAAAMSVLVFLGARTLAMLVAGRALGLPLRYRAWESGFPLGVVIAGLLGGYYANPGGLYPEAEEWRYRETLPRLGPVALAGAASTLVLLGLLRLLGLVAPEVGWRSLSFWIGATLSILDILIPFFPLACYNGRRIWDWSSVAWCLMAAATLALVAL